MSRILALRNVHGPKRLLLCILVSEFLSAGKETCLL